MFLHIGAALIRHLWYTFVMLPLLEYQSHIFILISIKLYWNVTGHYFFFNNFFFNRPQSFYELTLRKSVFLETTLKELAVFFFIFSLLCLSAYVGAQPRTPLLCVPGSTKIFVSSFAKSIDVLQIWCSWARSSTIWSVAHRLQWVPMFLHPNHIKPFQLPDLHNLFRPSVPMVSFRFETGST